MQLVQCSSWLYWTLLDFSGLRKETQTPWRSTLGTWIYATITVPAHCIMPHQRDIFAPLDLLWWPPDNKVTAPHVLAWNTDLLIIRSTCIEMQNVNVLGWNLQTSNQSVSNIYSNDIYILIIYIQIYSNDAWLQASKQVNKERKLVWHVCTCRAE